MAESRLTARIAARLVRRGVAEAPAEPPRGPDVLAGVGFDDHRPFLGESGIAELGRLVRYAAPDDPAANPFQAVKAGGLADAERIYVFVHGWVPGLRETADLLYAQEGGLVAAWDERVRNTVGQSMVQSYVPLLEALARTDPDSAVLWFSWVDQSGTDTTMFAARDSLKNTEVNGRRLALALAEAMGEGEGKVHLIGHSHGCVVSTHAALALPVAPAQLTLLDCPEDWFSRMGGAAGLLDHLLPRVQPGRTPDTTFVDAYASMFGRAYHDDPGLSEVVDVRLAPSVRPGDDATLVSQAHQYAVQWYAESVADPASASAGYAWSVLRGHDPADLGSGYLAAGTGRVVEVAKRKAQPQDRINSAYLVEAVGSASAELTKGSPDVLFSIEVGPGAVLLEFDYEIRRPGRGTRMEVALDRQLAFIASGRQLVSARGRYLRVLSPNGGEVIVQFRLRDAGLLTAATVSNLRVVRAPSAPRNFNDALAMASGAVLGAAVGSLATLGLVGAGLLVRRLVRGPRAAGAAAAELVASG